MFVPSVHSSTEASEFLLCCSSPGPNNLKAETGIPYGHFLTTNPSAVPVVMPKYCKFHNCFVFLYAQIIKGSFHRVVSKCRKLNHKSSETY